MPHGERIRQRLNAHIHAGGVVLGEAAGAHGALRHVEGAVQAPLSEGAAVALATGMALSGKAVVVDLIDPAGLARAADAVADLADLARRSEGAFRPTVLVRVPGGTPTTGCPLPVYVAGRASDAAEQLDAALSVGGACVLVDDTHEAAPEGIAPEQLGVPVVLQDGQRVTVLASGSDIVAALAGAQGSDARVVEVRGSGTLAPAVSHTGRLVIVGDLPVEIEAALNLAFWHLEAPWERLPRGADADAVRTAIHTVVGA